MILNADAPFSYNLAVAKWISNHPLCLVLVMLLDLVDLDDRQRGLILKVLPLLVVFNGVQIARAAANVISHLDILYFLKNLYLIKQLSKIDNQIWY